MARVLEILPRVRSSHSNWLEKSMAAERLSDIVEATAFRYWLGW